MYIIVFCEKLGIEKEKKKKQNRSGSCTPSVPLSLSLGKRDCEGGTVFQRQTQWDGGSIVEGDMSSPLMSHEQSYVY